jgi:hypothetical protein
MSDRTLHDKQLQNSHAELLAACKEALECIQEWELAGFVVGIDSLEQQLSAAIQNAVGGDK